MQLKAPDENYSENRENWKDGIYIKFECGLQSAWASRDVVTVEKKIYT